VVFEPNQDFQLDSVVQWEIVGVSDRWGNFLTQPLRGWFQATGKAAAWVDPYPYKGARNAKYNPDERRNQKAWVVSPQQPVVRLNAHLLPQTKNATCTWRGTGLLFKRPEGKKWSSVYRQARNFGTGLTKEGKPYKGRGPMTTLSSVDVRVKKVNGKLPTGKFQGTMTFVAGVNVSKETFTIYSLKAVVKVAKAEEISFNRFAVTLKATFAKGTVPKVTAPKNTKWTVKLPNGRTIRRSGVAEIYLDKVALPLKATVSGKYVSEKAENTCSFKTTTVVTYDYVWQKLSKRLLIRPIKDEINTDWGDTRPDDNVIRVLIKSPDGASHYEPAGTHKYPNAWKGKWSYQKRDGKTQDGVVEIQVYVEGYDEKTKKFKPLKGATVYLRAVDPPDYAPYAKGGWWLGAPRNNDNGDAGGTGGIGPTINYNREWDQKDYPLGAFVKDDVDKVLATDRFKNPIYVTVRTGEDGIAKVRFRVTDHMGGDNYYVIASLAEIKALPKNYRSLALGRQRTGCLTAWKRFIVWNFGMKDPQNPNKIYRANIGAVAEYFISSPRL